MGNVNKKDDQVVHETYIGAWIILVILTGLTVVLAGIKLGVLSVFVVLFIASLKSSVVLYKFMHIKQEPTIIKLVFVVTVLALAIFIGLTFIDVRMR